MNTLFDVPPLYPEGFSYLPDFISKEEEGQLLGELSKYALRAFNFSGYEAKRKVASFGQDWSFDKQSLLKGADIPPAFHPFIQKVADHLSIAPQSFEELLITEYPEGSVINWHRDAPPFDVIAGVSLLSDCTFRLRPYHKSKQTRSSVISLPVKRRSLYVLQGASRTQWQHSIAAVKEKRYSITLRTLRK